MCTQLENTSACSCISPQVTESILVIWLSSVDEESEESYAKRMKKINYLSLAQEFAELKKMDANALPFGLTCTSTLTGLSDGEEDGDERSTSILVSFCRDL